ncbi:MAG: hypothetical protein OEN20_05900 [Gammaproteobacteria bacterium]|nr:hypothetical protein [Gammaproteobacteria bacterium]
MSTGTHKTVGRWLVVLVLTLAFFYAMDLMIMGAQGLPLNWNMTPGN